MNLPSQKLEFIQWFSGLKNPTIIKEALILKERNQEDWWDMIDNEEKLAIKKGLAEADAKKTVSNDLVFSKWLSK